MFKSINVFLVAVIVGCALAAPAPEPNPEAKPHIIAPLAYSAFASPYVLPGYIASPFAPVVYRGFGGLGYNPFGYAGGLIF